MIRKLDEQFEQRMRDALLTGTDNAAERAPALWPRLQSAKKPQAHPRWVWPSAVTAAVAVAAVGLVLANPWHLGPTADVVSPPADGTGGGQSVVLQPSTGAVAGTVFSSPLASAGAPVGDPLKEFNRLQQAGATEGQLLALLSDNLKYATPAEAKELTARYIDLVDSKITIHTNYEDSASARLSKMAQQSDKAMAALIMLKGKTELGTLAGSFSDEDRRFLQNLFDSGCTVDFADGMPHAEVRYTELANLFGDNITQELKSYLAFSAAEAERPYALEGMFEVEPIEVAQRWQAAVQYLKEYPDASAARREKVDTYRQLYLAAYLTNFGGLFRVEDRIVPQDQKAWLDDQIRQAEDKAPQAAELLKAFKTVLANEGWKRTKAVLDFIAAQGVKVDYLAD